MGRLPLLCCQQVRAGHWIVHRKPLNFGRRFFFRLMTCRHISVKRFSVRLTARDRCPQFRQVLPTGDEKQQEKCQLHRLVAEYVLRPGKPLIKLSFHTSPVSRLIGHLILMHLAKDHLVHLTWVSFCRTRIKGLCRVKLLLKSRPIWRTGFRPEVGHLLADLFIKMVIFSFLHILYSRSLSISFSFNRAFTRFDLEVLSVISSSSAISLCAYPSITYKLKTAR